MVARVKMQGGVGAALQVSLPTFDVNTATLDQLAFDARFANMIPVLKGKVFVPYETWTTVSFGQTFSKIPRVFCGYNNSGGSSASPQPDPARIVNPGAILTSGAGTYLRMNLCQVTTSYMQFYAAMVSGVTDPTEDALIRSFANAYFHYAVYR